MRLGGGNLLTLTSANPAAGVEWSYTVPDGEVWKIHHIDAQLVTAATVGSRRVHIRFTDLDGSIIDAFSSVDQIISETKNYSVAHFGSTPDETDSNFILINIPDGILVNGGGTIRSVTTNLAAGDNWSVATILVEKYLAPFP